MRKSILCLLVAIFLCLPVAASEAAPTTSESMIEFVIEWVIDLLEGNDDAGSNQGAESADGGEEAEEDGGVPDYGPVTDPHG